MMNWKMIWGQSISYPYLSFMMPKRCTVGFEITSAVNAEKLRIRFSNLLGKIPTIVGECTIKDNGKRVNITKDGEMEFVIPCGESVYSDEVDLKVMSGESVEIRIYYKNRPMDWNAIEENANWVKHINLCHSDTFPPVKRSKNAMMDNAFYPIPIIDSIEVYTDHDPAIIVAFGDSITQQSFWTKPLAAKLFDRYQDQVVLINKGIGGNRILQRGKGLMRSYGEAAIERFDRDVLEINGVKCVIIALGTNDIGFYKLNWKDHITTTLLSDAIKAMAEELRARHIRVVGTTLLPRMGSAHYNDRQEAIRKEFNEWIRINAGFDYVADFDKATQDGKYGNRLKEIYDCGDHLHPSREGGKAMAEAIDLERLLSFNRLTS